MGNILRTIVVGFLAGLSGAYVFYNYQQRNNTSSEPPADYKVTSYNPSETYKPTMVMPSAAVSLAGVDFSDAATKAIPSVVYINSISPKWRILFILGFAFQWRTTNPGEQRLRGNLYIRRVHRHQQPCRGVS